MPNPTAAMLTIGDEILSGRTRDSNMPHLAQALAARGISLREARVVPDEQAEIVAALNALRARYDHVFTSGGIGPTHDDITADAIAAAFGVGIDVRDDARARCGMFESRVRPDRISSPIVSIAAVGLGIGGLSSLRSRGIAGRCASPGP